MIFSVGTAAVAGGGGVLSLSSCVTRVKSTAMPPAAGLRPLVVPTTRTRW
jgi:hypothetical protein